MGFYRKKPVDVEAIQYTGGNLDDILNFCGNKAYYMDTHLFIISLEGDMVASVNDYIIKGVQGEFYPCKPDIFEETYDEL